MRLGVASAIVDDERVAGDVEIVEGVVTRVGLPPGTGGLAIPGMVDLQVNGYAGVDFLTSDEDGWRAAAAALLRDGVTSFVANLITSPEAVAVAALQVAARVVGDTAGGAARLLGAHLEGPFLAPAKAGVHPPAALRRPDPALLEGLRAAGPGIGMTLAPELPGAGDLISRLTEAGVLVALGHSSATGGQAQAGFTAGARAVTHLFNGMSTPTARDPGLAGVALVRDDVAVQLICDGVHLALETVQLALAAAGPRLVLVTDALSAAAAPDGAYRLGGTELQVVDGRARRADGTLAGSTLTMAGALRRLVAAGAPLELAVAAATTRPAALLGRGDLGRLRPGDPADVVVLDDDLVVTAVHRAGPAPAAGAR